MVDKVKVTEFWKKKHLALFGLSRDPQKISRKIYDILINKNYTIYPINPNAEYIDNIKCFKSLDEIDRELDGAVVMTNPAISLDVTKQCHKKGIKELWFQLDTIDKNVKSYLNEHNIIYVYSCALLYHKEAGFPHTWHKFFYDLFQK